MSDAAGKYLSLIRSFPLRQKIKTDAEFHRAIRLLGRLLGAETLSNRERQYLETLEKRIREYEEKTSSKKG